MRHHDHLLVRRHSGQLASLSAQQAVEHAELDGVQVRQPLSKASRAGPEIPQLQCLELIRGLGAEVIVAYQGLDRFQELLVLGHENLGVEDAGLFRAGPLKYPLAQLL